MQDSVIDYFDGGKPHRLVDYFVVVGVNHQQLQQQAPRKKEFESAVDLRPLTDIKVIYNNHIKDKQLLNDYISLVVNCNSGSLLGPEIFLYTSTVVPLSTITGLDIIYPSRGERSKVGYSQVKGNLNKGGTTRVVLCIERGRSKPPVLDIQIINESEGGVCPMDYIKIPKNLNVGSLMADNLFICYRTAAAYKRSAVYEPTVLDRYPLQDYSDSILRTDSISQFAFPTGVELSKGMQPPSFFSFVLTNTTGNQTYGACLHLYELYEPPLDKKNGKHYDREQNKDKKEKKTFCPK